jgi:hypothetical protein
MLNFNDPITILSKIPKRFLLKSTESFIKGGTGEIRAIQFFIRTIFFLEERNFYLNKKALSRNLKKHFFV